MTMEWSLAAAVQLASVLNQQTFKIMIGLAGFSLIFIGWNEVAEGKAIFGILFLCASFFALLFAIV